MEDDDFTTQKSAPRKMKFKPNLQPKPRPRRTPKPAEKNEVLTDVEAEEARELARLVSERSGRRGPKAEREAGPVQVAFGVGASTSIRTFGQGSSSSASKLQCPVSYIGSSSSSASGLQYPISDDGLKALRDKKKKEYKEPWDYSSYYPVTLPLRKPNSGNQELLDEKEFGEASANLDYDESSINSAKELELMEECETERMLFLQLPSSLPLVKRSANAKGKDVTGTFNPGRSASPSEKGCSLEELPAGFMGKMLVYKSGAIKLRLGDTVYDVSPGSECVFAQEVAAINIEEKHCCVLGELDKRATVTPDVDFLLQQLG